MIRYLFLFASSNLVYLMPIAIIFGLLAGLLFDTSSLKSIIIPVVIIMIYPTTIGVRLRELMRIKSPKLLVCSLAINFLLVPWTAYLLGLVLFSESPNIFAGLAIASLLPTSNMTVAFTMLARGNIEASIRLTFISLCISAVLLPGYLYLMIGKHVPVDIMTLVETLVMVIVIPCTLGVLTGNFLRKRFSEYEFMNRIKPLLPGPSALGALVIIFTSVSMNAKLIINGLSTLMAALASLLLFYMLNYVMAVVASRAGRFNKEDGYALVYSTVLRNLAISMGIAISAFGYEAALMVSMAFLIQPVAASWFARFNERYGILQ
jgi:ACR3 family arsenite efflux pump ArsB